MDYLPTTWCITPQQAADAYTSKKTPSKQELNIAVFMFCIRFTLKSCVIWFMV